MSKKDRIMTIEESVVSIYFSHNGRDIYELNQLLKPNTYNERQIDWWFGIYADRYTNERK